MLSISRFSAAAPKVRMLATRSAIAGLDGDRALDGAGDCDAAVAGGVAVAIAGGAAGADLRDAPGDRESRARGAREDHCALFGDRLDSGEGGIWDVEHRAPRFEGVNDGAADEVR